MAEPYPGGELERLAARLGVPFAALGAVAEVESSGRGFMGVPSRTPDGVDVSGRPVIRFESHVFWRELGRRGRNPADVQAPRRDLLSAVMMPRWSRSPAGEWDRLLAARGIDRDAADSSASWGAFQVMGFNWRACGAGSLGDFVARMGTAEGQLELFAGFLEGDPALVRALRGRDWAGFARRYNGPGYAAGGYDSRLERAYRARGGE